MTKDKIKRNVLKGVYDSFVNDYSLLDNKRLKIITFDDLGMDSLDLLEFQFRIEDVLFNGKSLDDNFNRNAFLDKCKKQKHIKKEVIK
jgi:acyl carrier protein